jgi:hypothetical protein
MSALLCAVILVVLGGPPATSDADVKAASLVPGRTSAWGSVRRIGKHSHAGRRDGTTSRHTQPVLA